MKQYVRPSMEMSLFTLNETIAACPTTDTYNPVRVDCVITKHHHVFYTGCETVSNCPEPTDCDGGANYNDVQIVTYQGSEYMVWLKSDGGEGGDPIMPKDRWEEDEGETTSVLQLILNAGYEQGLPTSYTAQNSHAGLITPDIDSVRNASV